MVLGPSDQRDRNDDGRHDRAPLVVGVDRALVLAVFDVPDRQVVARVVLPPGEAHAARAADAGRTGDAAAARDPVRRPVDPDDVANGRLQYLLRDAGTREQHREVLGAEGGRRRLEPGIHLVLEVFRGVHLEAVLTVSQPVADALHEILFGFVRRVLLARKNDDVLALADDGIGLLVRLQTRGDAARADQG